MASNHPEPSDAGHGQSRPSNWVMRFAGLIATGGRVLDVAAGSGRHARLLRRLGHPVVAVDRDIGALTENHADPGLQAIAADLESGAPWPLARQRFAGVVVTNYLYRPILGDIVGSVEAEGILIYETFAAGNAAFGRPRNPDFLLRPAELLDLARQTGLRVIAYEDGIERSDGLTRAVQRLCAARNDRLYDLMADAGSC